MDDNSTCNDTVDEVSNFTQLNHEIENSRDYLNLTKDYTYVEGEEEITINKSMTIDGNSHFITVNTTIFEIEDNTTLFFKNINFIILDEFNITTHSNITLFDCRFDLNNTFDCVCPLNYDNSYSPTGNISSDIVILAYSIVGDSKDIAAAKKLAKWVGQNILHETREGFYQTPSETVLRKLGNCCSQTDLFLQMCDAIGLTKTHKLSYVHVGYINFGDRHFFAMIDNVIVDVDAKPNSPWGRASFSSGDVFSIIPYPMLPLQRSY